MLVFVTRIAAPETGGFTTAIALLTGAVLGGLGTISGAVIGALVVMFVPYYTSDFMSGGGFLFIPASDARGTSGSSRRATAPSWPARSTASC